MKGTFVKKPSKFLDFTEDSLFIEIILKKNGNVVIASTRHKNAFLQFTEFEVEKLATDEFLYQIPTRYLEGQRAGLKTTQEFTFDMKFDNEWQDVGSKRLTVSEFQLEHIYDKNGSKRLAIL